LFFGPAIIHPNDYLFATGGDGSKNYFTPAYAVRYDQGTEFSGMNYPFGEHIVYTDAQPLITWLLQSLDSMGLPVDGNVPGILNLLMLLSVIPAAFFYQKILQHYRIPWLWSVWAATCFAFLSPQAHRWWGHFALGYTVFVPMFWYLALRFEKDFKVSSWFWLFIGILAFGFIHLYYLLIAAGLLFTYWISTLILKRENWNARLIAAAGILPMLVVMIFIRLSDQQVDRPPTPWGFTRYKTDLDAVFLPPAGPLSNLIRSTMGINSPEWEGWGYVGLMGSLALVFVIFRGTRKLFQQRRLGASRLLKSIRSSSLAPWVFAAFFTLLFAMAIPFRWDLEVLLDALPPLKQFRSPGRMIWAFYSVWTVFSLIVLYRWSKAWGRRFAFAAPGLMLFALSFWSLDAWYNSGGFVRRGLPENFFKQEKFQPFLDQQGINVEDYQTLMVFPYYHMGSEQIYLERGSLGMQDGMHFSYETGLPMHNVMMSRTSLSQTLANLAWVSPYSDDFSSINVAIEDGRPILIMLAVGELSPYELNILEKAERIGKMENGLRFYSLNPESLLQKQALPEAPYAPVVHLDFEEGGEDGLFGSSAYQKRGPWDLVDMQLPKGDTSAFNFSCWIKIDERVAGVPHINYEVMNDLTHWLNKGDVQGKWSTDIYRNWVRVEGEIRIPEESTRLRIYAQGEHIYLDKFYLWKD
jgi:hypothetical protein